MFGFFKKGDYAERYEEVVYRTTTEDVCKSLLNLEKEENLSKIASQLKIILKNFKKGKIKEVKGFSKPVVIYKALELIKKFETNPKILDIKKEFLEMALDSLEFRLSLSYGLNCDRIKGFEAEFDKYLKYDAREDVRQKIKSLLIEKHNLSNCDCLRNPNQESRFKNPSYRS